MQKQLYQSNVVFPTPDMQKTANYYHTVLGFEIVEQMEAEIPHICLCRDETEIILVQSDGKKVIPNRELYGHGYDAYFVTNQQEALLQEFTAAGAKIALPIHETEIGNVEFLVEDIDGRYIGFGWKAFTYVKP
ncbi:VOC family protein [Clostridia bacterium OttesenSCG-928-F22]|nr:VOC family protein [Clostridia bacterium OttesenSCG-928-F22]